MYERQFVEYALQLAKEAGMTQREFAARIRPDKTPDSANTTIIALKRTNRRGKPQNLRVSDAIRMSEIVGREYTSMSFEVWERVKISQSISHVAPEFIKAVSKREEVI